MSRKRFLNIWAIWLINTLIGDMDSWCGMQYGLQRKMFPYRERGNIEKHRELFENKQCGNLEIQTQGKKRKKLEKSEK